MSGFAANDVATMDPHLIIASVLSTTLVNDYADSTALGVVPIGDGKELSAQTAGHIRAGSQVTVSLHAMLQIKRVFVTAITSSACA